MSGAAKVPELARAMAIEWRARRIADPLCRLQYLRGVTGSGGGRRFGPWTRGVYGLLLVLIPLVPAREAGLSPAAGNLQTEPPPAVWMVETTGDHETYSNGLRVENRYAIETHRRSYGVFARSRPESDTWQRRTEPAGIVYHATESDLAPFEAEENARLQRIDEALLDYVQRRQSYHFAIDRFGRVYRVVVETDSANHAGSSIWADRQWVYCNLNAAFLGIAFEARTEAGRETPLDGAQIRAGRALTDMLRSRYRIAAENCVTHAQVSVNPRNMEIGYHTDWAAHFPFEAMGLADNYRLPVASVLLFGFGYSSTFLRAVDGHAWEGLASAQETAQEQAAAHGLSWAGYARLLQKRYGMKMGALHSKGALEEIGDEQK
jgi:hypothetical protein